MNDKTPEDQSADECTAAVVLMPTNPELDDMPLTGQELPYGCIKPAGHEGPHEADQKWMWTDEKSAHNFYAVTYAPGKFDEEVASRSRNASA